MNANLFDAPDVSYVPIDGGLQFRKGAHERLGPEVRGFNCRPGSWHCAVELHRRAEGKQVHPEHEEDPNQPWGAVRGGGGFLISIRLWFLRVIHGRSVRVLLCWLKGAHAEL